MILSLIVFLVIFYLFMAPKIVNEGPVIRVEKRCAPHKWEEDINGRLICDWCKQRPGQIQTKNGEY